MTRTRWAAIAAIALALAFLGGRLSAPRSVVVVEKKTEHEAERKTWDERKTETAAIAEKSQTAETVKVVTRWLRPNGTTAKEKTEEKGRASTSSKDSVAVVSSSAAATADKVRTVVERREVRIVERPRWAVDGLFGLDLTANRVWGARVAYRLAGPVSVGAFFLSPKTAGVSVGVSW